jgi:general L-amino acid transport system substrate-binding protein
VLKGTTSELNVKDYFTVNRMRYRLAVFETAQEALAAYEAGECSVLTSDQSQLYALRTRLADPDASEILPEVISKEPLSPVVRAGDDAWLSIVRWSLFAMIEAEELQITSANVERVREDARNPTVRRLLGLDGNPGSGLGLADDWAYQIIRQVGNYGEVFERNVGLGSPLKMTRGLNAVWSAGGLMYSPPFR